MKVQINEIFENHSYHTLRKLFRKVKNYNHNEPRNVKNFRKVKNYDHNEPKLSLSFLMTFQKSKVLTYGDNPLIIVMYDVNE